MAWRGKVQKQMVGWYALVEMVDETRLWRKVEAMVRMRLVAVGWRADG